MLAVKHADRQTDRHTLLTIFRSPVLGQKEKEINKIACAKYGVRTLQSLR